MIKVIKLLKCYNIGIQIHFSIVMEITLKALLCITCSYAFLY